MKSVSPQTTLDFLKVYLITHRKVLPKGFFLQGIQEALEGGVRSIQLREKDLNKDELLALGKKVVKLTIRYGAKLFVNHHPEIAEASGADGVHLTETTGLDLETTDPGFLLDSQALRIRNIKKQYPHLCVGVSTHSLESALAAEAGGADFITFSPIFDTPSKRAYGAPQGLDCLEEVAAGVTLPVLALGGIKLENALSVIKRGAFGIAMISGIWNSKNIKETTEQFMKLIAGDIL